MLTTSIVLMLNLLSVYLATYCILAAISLVIYALQILRQYNAQLFI